VVEAIDPYCEQIKALDKQVGAQFSRQTMKDASGASMMDPGTQVSKIHNTSILDASKHTFEANLVYSLLKEYPSAYGEAIANMALNGYVNQHGQATLAAAEAARENGSSPNTVVASAVGIVGRKSVQKAIDAAQALLELFQFSGLQNPEDKFDHAAQLKEAGPHKAALVSSGEDACAGKWAEGLKKAGNSVFVNFLLDLAKQEKGHVGRDALLAATWMTLGWRSLRSKKISKYTLTHLPWYSRVFSTLVGVTAPASRHSEDAFSGVKITDLVGQSFTQTAFMALLGRAPSKNELFEFQVLLGLIITNGPGTISAQGAKGAVSADGPEQPERVQINKSIIGFLSHTGFAHGGNGYEAAAFLIEKFKDQPLKSADDKNHGIDLEKIAMDTAKAYASYKGEQKAIGNLEYAKIPCVNHPVFKGKDVNMDPREEFVRKLFEEKKLANVFLDFYHHLVNALFKAKVSKNVYCVNIDAVIAVILLKVVWKEFKAGKLKEEDIESASFATFLFGRMIGCAAEIDDHTNRGRNMDTRTPASQVAFVG